MSSAIAKARARLARWIAPNKVRQVGTRMYHNARQSRLTVGWSASDTSADTELVASLRVLRARSRALVRDAPYAKRAKVVVVNNVIGTGIGMQAQVRFPRGELMEKVNAGIEAAWSEWCEAENCHTGGRLSFPDMERHLIGQVFEGGEIFVRKHPFRFGRSRVPLALEIVEPERLAEEYTQPHVTGETVFKLGVEQDRFGRPVAFWMRELHPAEMRQGITRASDHLYRVPANQIFHIAPVDRWPQTRGEPWLHAAARRLNDMDGYSEAEIVAARGAASYMAVRKPALQEDGLADSATETPEFDLEPGAVPILNPGEEIEFHSPNRPNPAMDPFMRMMLREVAAGAGVAYESISRDYSQSNYSSSRLALLEDRDNWTAIQQWFIRSFRVALHREWLQAAVMAGAIPAIDIASYANDPKRYEAVTFKPRGWTYINPKEDADAAIAGIRAGLTTRTIEIARYGNGYDVEDIDALRRQELDAAAAKNLVFTTDPERFDNAGKEHPAEVALTTEPNTTPADDRSARVMTLAR